MPTASSVLTLVYDLRLRRPTPGLVLHGGLRGLTGRPEHHLRVLAILHPSGQRGPRLPLVLTGCWLYVMGPTGARGSSSQAYSPSGPSRPASCAEWSNSCAVLAIPF